ncbi:MAG: T9SS type A sorting domain-containing protein [Chitinophagales bacterium]
MKHIKIFSFLVVCILMSMTFNIFAQEKTNTENNVEITQKDGVKTITIENQDGQKRMIQIEGGHLTGNSEGAISVKPHQNTDKTKNVEKNNTNANKASLGVQIRQKVKNIDGVKTNCGIIVQTVFKESAAEAAGLKQGDIIRAIDGNQLVDMRRLIGALNKFKIGDKTKITYERGEKRATTTVTLKENTPKNSAQTQNANLKLPGILIKTKNPKTGKIETDRIYFNVWIQDVESTDVEKIENSSLKKDIAANTLAVETLKFYPNPSNGRFNMSFNIANEGETLVRIVDMTGREVFRNDLGRNFVGSYDKQIDISQNPRGIYFLQIKQNNNVLVKKITVQ